MMGAYVESAAILSPCERYRYLLRRVWDVQRPRALFVMLNPSTADAQLDDATIRSCVRLSSGHGYGSIEVVNLFGWRTTDPRDLVDCADPIGPDNDRVIEAALGHIDMPICAWGANLSAAARARRVWEMIRAARPAAMCFGKTKNGAPKHPLYIKSGTPLEVYQPMTNPTPTRAKEEEKNRG